MAAAGMGASASAAAPRPRSIGPGDDFCAAVRALEPGGELALAPGDYAAGCSLAQAGTAEAPVVIRAADPAHRPHLVYTGTQSNVLNIRGNHVVVRGLAFGPTQLDVDAIRVYARQDVTIEDCEFSDIRGIPIVANHVSLRGLTVRRNTILDSHSTAMYFGCHDGASCEIWDIVVERNYVRRTGLAREGIGFGVQIKLNSAAIIRDNVIVQPRGPAIMVYGARDARRASLVEGNFVQGSLQSSGIVIGGGPAVVRNNVSADNADAGIGLEDYGRRGLVREIAVAHNTILGNARGGIVVRAGSVHDVNVVNNAVHARTGALPTARPGLRSAGNVECPQPALCFRDPAARDFSPGLALRASGIALSEPWAPHVDFSGFRRAAVPTAGAFERDVKPIQDGPKPASAAR